MAENDDHFTPESVDEQVERFSQANNSKQYHADDGVNAFLVQDLHGVYRSQSEAKQRTLDQAWKRIAKNRQERASSESNTQPLPMPVGGLRTQRGNRSGAFQQHLGVIAAVLVACILVGSMFVILNVARLGGRTAANPGGTAQTLIYPTINPTQYKLGATITTYHDQHAIHSVDWSPDGTRIASASDTVQVWSAATGAHILTHTPTGQTNFFAARWSPDGTQIVSAAPIAEVWNATSGKTVSSCPDPVQEIAMSSGTIGVGALSLQLETSSATTSLLAAGTPLSDKGALPTGVVWSPDGKYIAAAYRNPAKPTIAVWEAGTCKQIASLHYHNDIPIDVVWSPDGRYIAASTSDRVVQIWEVATRKLVYTYHDYYNTDVYSVAWSPDSKQIASSSFGSTTVEVWNALTGTINYIYHDHRQPVLAVAWSPDGKYIASGSSISQGGKMVGEVRVWKPDTGELHYSYKENVQPVLAVAWSPDGKFVASSDGVQSGSPSDVGSDGTVKVWVAE